MIAREGGQVILGGKSGKSPPGVCKGNSSIYTDNCIPYRETLCSKSARMEWPNPSNKVGQSIHI